MNVFDVSDDICCFHDDAIVGISILIPLYNGIEYLDQSIKSVINQTYSKWEVIIGINGHEKDSSIQKVAQTIIDNVGTKHIHNIQIKHYDTIGKSNTLNAMVKDTKYDYIAILDVDDYWVNFKLEAQIPYLKKYDVVGGRCNYFGDKNNSPPIPVGDISDSHNIFAGNPIINSSVIIHKNDAIWDDDKYVPAIKGLDDYSLWFKLFFLKRKFYNVDQILCYHRIHNDSAFNNTNNDRVQELKQLWLDYYTKQKQN